MRSDALAAEPAAGAPGFEDSWVRFNEWVTARSAGDGMSSMWQVFIKDFDVHRKSGILPRDLKSFAYRDQRFRGYGFVKPGQNYPILKALLRLNYFVVRALNVFRGWIWSVSEYAWGITELTGHAAGQRELARRGLWEGYVAFCREHGFVPGGLNSMKCFYVAAQLQREFDKGGPADVLEIGGGIGSLAVVMLGAPGIRQYVIVDLPEMILNSSIAVRALYPDLPAYFLYPGSADKYKPGERGIYFCAAEVVDTIDDDSFEAAINVDSFQEMTEAQVQLYLGLVQRTVRNGGVFLNLNRRKFLRPESFDNNPLMYPYARDNVIRRWETDYFMARTLNLGGTRPDPWVLRSETVVK